MSIIRMNRQSDRGLPRYSANNSILITQKKTKKIQSRTIPAAILTRRAGVARMYTRISATPVIWMTNVL
jgi:hypothetical protein